VAGNIGHYNIVVPEGAVAINPLNWQTDETPAGINENLVSLVFGESGGFEIVGGLADARIDISRGSVIVSTVDPSKYSSPSHELSGPESFHGWNL